MWRKKEQKFKLSLMLIAMSCLSCCAPTNCEPLPSLEFPHGGPKVAAELEQLSAAEYPYLWAWLARLYKLKQEIEAIEGR